MFYAALKGIYLPIQYLFKIYFKKYLFKRNIRLPIIKGQYFILVKKNLWNMQKFYS